MDTKALLAKDAVILRIPEHVFDKHKDIFTVLLFSTETLRAKLGIKKTADIELISDLFGNKFNMKKLSKFLEMEAIQYLWWGFKSDEPNDDDETWTFYKSQSMHKMVKKLPLADVRKSLAKSVKIGH